MTDKIKKNVGGNTQESAVIQRLLRHQTQEATTHRHYKFFEYQLMEAENFSALLDVLLDASKAHFTLASVSLFIVDNEYSLYDLFEHLSISQYKNCLQVRHNEDFVSSIYREQKKVYLGDTDILSATRLFPDVTHVKSVALMPLIQRGKLIGSLHFASDNEHRFTPDKSTDLLEYFSRVVAMTLENSINREMLLKQSRIDLLTQVNNRLCFNMELPLFLKRAQRSAKPLTSFFIDIDHFKAINDQYGHQAGDMCLRHVASTIQQQLRKTDLLARYGGEEFVVLMPECAAKKALDIAERVRQAVESVSVALPKGQAIKTTVSIGVTTIVIRMPDSDLQAMGVTLLEQADAAMYRAKHNGRNQIVQHRDP